MKPDYESPGVQLYCGDCLDILPTLKNIDAVITDPPYGMKMNTNSKRFVQGERSHGGSRGGVYAPVIGDDSPFDPTPWISFKKVIMWGYHHYAMRLPVGTVLAWIKRNEKAYGTFLSDAELAWMKGGHGVYCRKDMSMYGQAKNRLHPTQKPVGIMEWCIAKTKIPEDGIVLDPYMGSGTTGVACVNTGRKFIGIEIEQEYFDIAVKRIEEAQQQASLL